MSKRDYYEVLGVQRNADESAIKSAYRKLARQYHPDVNKAPDAEERFKEVNEAYEMLSDADKRQTYDRFGHAAPQGGFGAGGPGAGFGGMGGFGDLFEGAGYQADPLSAMQRFGRGAPGAADHLGPVRQRHPLSALQWRAGSRDDAVLELPRTEARDCNTPPVRLNPGRRG